MRHVPVLPTVVVTLAVATMIALGLWQLLIRLPAKEAELRLLAANPLRPAVTFPTVPDDALLFRRSSVTCLRVTAVRLVGGGGAGFRAIAECVTGAEGSGATVALGTTRDPKAQVRWSGGTVTGYLSHSPDSRPLIAGLWDHTPRRQMLVADTPAPGLTRNTPPDVAGVPNNHLAYAGQWFFFAAVATLIYVLALRRRRPSSPRP